MRRLIPLLAVALAATAAAPAHSAVRDTSVDRHNERVGELIHKGASRFDVRDLSDTTKAEVRRQGNRRFNFWTHDGAFIGYVRKASGNRWDVFRRRHSEPIGHVSKVGKDRFGAYRDEGERIGEARGPAAVAGAASVLLIFRG